MRAGGRLACSRKWVLCQVWSERDPHDVKTHRVCKCPARYPCNGVPWLGLRTNPPARASPTANVRTRCSAIPYRHCYPCPPDPEQSRDGDFAAGRPTTFDFGQDNVRSDSWKASQRAQQERYDAAEARGYGLYSLHAVIGQGTFGRIHLASWQHRGRGVDSTAASSAAPAAAAASFSRSLSSGGSSSSATGGGGGSGSDARGRAAEGERESCRPSSSSPGSTNSVSATSLAHGTSSRSEASTPRGSRGAVGGVAGAGAGTRATGRHRISSSTGSVRSLFGSNGGEALQSLFAEDDGCWDGEGEGEGGQLRLRALKSVCKRKVTEKGLVRHMETVSGVKEAQAAVK